MDVTAIESGDGIEDVLIGEVRLVGRKLVEEEGDEMNIVLGGVAATWVPLEADRDASETTLVLRAINRVQLGGGEGGSAARRAAEVCGRGKRSRQG